MKNLHFRKFLTPRELKLYLADDWQGFDKEMKKRLLKSPWSIQNKLLTVSKLLCHRAWWRGINPQLTTTLLDTLAGKL